MGVGADRRPPDGRAVPNRREFLGLSLAAVAGPAAAAPVRERDGEPFPLPEGVVARLGSPRFRHPEYVHDLRFGPGGSILYVETLTRMWAWQADTGRLVRSWPL